MHAKDEKGYQRPLKDSRITQIERYLSKDIGTFPTSILANVRGKIECETRSLDGGHEVCELTIPDKALPLWVIDGQRRMQGLKAAIEKDPKLRNYPLIVSLFTLPEIYEEMLQCMRACNTLTRPPITEHI